MPVDWDPVFQKGAESFAEAFASSLGGPLGGALANAILGGSSGDGKALEEVNQTLLRIEGKLNAVIQFIQERLPELIFEKVTDAIVTQRALDVLSARIAVHGALAVMAKPITPGKFEALQVASNGIAQMGWSIIKNGPAWYDVAVNAMCSAMMGYRRLMQIDPVYSEQLLTWARAYLVVLNKWLDENDPHSIPAAVSLRQHNLDSARANAAALTQGDFVSSFFGPNLSADDNGAQEWGYGVIQSALTQTPTGWAATPRIPNGLLYISVPDGGAYPNLQNVVALGTRVYSFWRPPIWPAFNNGRAHAFNDQAVALINDIVLSLPKKEEELEAAKRARDVVTKLVEALNCLTSPSHLPLKLFMNIQ